MPECRTCSEVFQTLKEVSAHLKQHPSHNRLPPAKIASTDAYLPYRKAQATSETVTTLSRHVAHEIKEEVTEAHGPRPVIGSTLCALSDTGTDYAKVNQRNASSEADEESTSDMQATAGIASIEDRVEAIGVQRGLSQLKKKEVADNLQSLDHTGKLDPHIESNQSLNREPTHTNSKQIMETNDSSTISKRSVERFYYTKPHFFNHFFKKAPTRRAPLIHRGYWLRMKSVRKVLEGFLDHYALGDRRVVINLGCGNDTLPFEMLKKKPDYCHNATFVDVDYPALINKKCETIRQTGELSDLLNKASLMIQDGDIMLKSEQYVALGCDLNDIERLDSIIRAEFPVASSVYLFIAEVSITYMDTAASNRLISWAARLGNAQFCLLEQYLPNGPEYPFAKTMLQHFEKLRSPLRSVRRYHNLEKQAGRFRSAGWEAVEVMSLWEAWSNSSFVPIRERMQLNSREQFDEWEEFALFASHYFLLVAHTKWKTTPVGISSLCSDLSLPDSTFHDLGESSTHSRARSNSLSNIYRRYGAVFETDCNIFAHHGGSNEKARTSSTDCWALDDDVQPLQSLPNDDIGSRLCHTITTLNNELDCLLVGGRQSPDKALKDCWLRRKGVWERVDDLPMRLYRHSAALIGTKSGKTGVLIFGGRSEHGAASNEWLLWQDRAGWRKVEYPDIVLKPRFGAAMVFHKEMDHGLLIGGMAEDGTVIKEVYTWTIHFEAEPLSISLRDQSPCSDSELKDICRFGACLIDCPLGTVLVGGLNSLGPPSRNREILAIKGHTHPPQGSVQVLELLKDRDDTRVVSPLLVGHSALWDGRGLAVIGGGAVCFSFGSYNNQHVWRLNVDLTVETEVWKYQGRDINTKVAKRFKLTANDTRGDEKGRTKLFIPIPRKSLDYSSSFACSIHKSKPFVIEGSDFGCCVEKWTTQYLKRHVGPSRKVAVHQTQDRAMVFQSGARNFEYATMDFGDFMESVSTGRRQYFRALASSDHKNEPADFHKDFEGIAPDFIIPPELALIRERFHSSVLRISGLVAMWLHYDVMANVLFQIRGEKKLLLFPPKDVIALKIPPGESNSPIDLFDPATLEDDHLRDVSPNEVTLRPGEALYIPPFWLHTASPNDGMSVAVNVFFRSLEADAYAKTRDTYGNRDLQAYESGRRDAAMMVKRFNGLPQEVSRFYLTRLCQEILK